MSYQFTEKIVNGEEVTFKKIDFVKPVEANQVLCGTGFAQGSQYKAYSTIQWKSNTLDTTLTMDTWARIKTNQAPTLGANSGHSSIDLVSGQTDEYEFKYTGTQTRSFVCHVHFGIDFSRGANDKIFEFRMVYNGIPLSPFLQVQSSKNGESCSSSIIMALNQNDVVNFQVKNTTDSNAILVQYFQMVCHEL